MTPLHPARRRRAATLAGRNPSTDWEDIYRRTVLREFPHEARIGFQLAFYRPQAVPRMAAVLAGTGHLQANPTRRAYDTGIVIHEIIYNGFDSERGRKMVRLMRALHARPDIHQEDLTHVLNSLIVIPTRFIARAGWRSLSDVERDATWRFWQELGTRMDLERLPGSYADAEAQFDAYEAQNLAPSPDGQRLTGHIITAFESWLPGPLSPHAAAITSALIDDPRFSAALGLPRPRKTHTAALRAFYAIRRVRQRLSAPTARPSFTPGQPAGRIYPHGYALDDIGPRTPAAT